MACKPAWFCSLAHSLLLAMQAVLALDAWCESLLGPVPWLTACFIVMPVGMKLGVIGLGGLGHMAVKFGKALGLEVGTHCDCAPWLLNTQASLLAAWL